MAVHHPPQHDAILLTWGAQMDWAEAVLAHAGSPSPGLDAAVLLQWLVRGPPPPLGAGGDGGLSSEQARCFGGWVARRAEGEPVSYITGHKAFMGLDLHVDRRALLVRPMTQVLVEIVLEMARLRPQQDLLVADVGTGSGALALALAALEPSIARI